MYDLGQPEEGGGGMPCGVSGEPPAGPGWYCSMFLNMQCGEYVRRCEEEC